MRANNVQKPVKVSWLLGLTGQCTICRHNEISDCAHSLGPDSSKLNEHLFKWSIVKTFCFKVLMNRPLWLFHDGMSYSFLLERACLWFLQKTKFCDCMFFHDFKMCCRMIGQYTICGDNDLSDYKMQFNFTYYNIIKWYTSCEDMKHYDWTRHNLWVQRIPRLQNLFHFGYLQDDQTIHN